MATLSSKIAPSGLTTLNGTETLSNKTLVSPVVSGDTSISGTVTATAFSGDGSNLTNLPFSGVTTGKAIAMAIVFG